MLSKGHAAPLLYAAWAEAGAFDRAELLKLRRIDSDLEGHPTPRLPFVDVATGSLGQGICAAVGIALNARRIGSDYRTYVLIGDGESAEGSVWEAADVAAIDGLDNLCAITDVNALGQSRPTMWQHDMDAFSRRWRAFGWQAIVIDGHDLDQILDAYEEARRTKGRPTMILARTIKGKGVSFAEGKDGWHGRAYKKGEELDRALAELEQQLVPDARGREPRAADSQAGGAPRPEIPPKPIAPPSYKAGEQVATREAYGTAIAKLGEADSRVVALDADVKNSTFSDKFEKALPDRFYENFIAEQVMIGASMGFAARGAIPFPSTFACFLSRAADFIRMAAISNVGHQDGRLARRRVDRRRRPVADGARGSGDVPRAAESHRAVPVRRGQHRASRRAGRVHTGPGLHPDQPPEDAGHLLDRRGVHDRRPEGAARERERRRHGHRRRRDRVRSAQGPRSAEGVRRSSIRVIDLYSVAPVDRAALVVGWTCDGRVLITVEDHYAAGGIGDAVAEAVADAGFTVHRLAVREIPRSGKPEELLERYGISAGHIVEAVRAMKGRKAVGATADRR